MQQAGSLDVDKVAAVVFNGLKFECGSGTFQMITRPDMGNNRTVDTVRALYLKKVVGGKTTLLATISIDEALGYLRVLFPAETQSTAEELAYYAK